MKFIQLRLAKCELWMGGFILMKGQDPTPQFLLELSQPDAAQPVFDLAKLLKMC